MLIVQKVEINSMGGTVKLCLAVGRKVNQLRARRPCSQLHQFIRVFEEFCDKVQELDGFRAAEWIVGQQSGLYSMLDVLGLK